MAEGQCASHAETALRVSRLEEATKDLETDVQRLNCDVARLDKDNAVQLEKFTTALNNIADVSFTLKEMQKTMGQMQTEFVKYAEISSGLQENVKALNDKINKVEEKEHISILDTIKQNWMAIALAVYLIIEKLAVK